MNTRNFIAALVLGVLVAAPVAHASVHADIDTNEKNFAPSVSSWKEYGAADAHSDGRVELSSTSKSQGSVYADIDVASKHEGDYALFISFTRAEDPHSNLSSGAENIAGLPYLYAYLMDEDGGIVEYVQDDGMRHRASSGTAWRVTYGVQKIGNDTESIRYFLKQASRNGTTPDGRSAWFYDPGLYIVDNLGDAMDVVDAYEDELGEVSDDFRNSTSHTSDSDDDDDEDSDDEDTDYPVGTLLKCSGDPDVYSMTSANTLKRFPDEDTFYAWGHSFADVKNVSCSKLDDYRVSGTWTYDRANYLVKFRGQPAVFTLDNGKYLRLIPDEYTASRMFGSDWVSDVREYSTSKMGDYYYSTPHTSLR